jgi:outer membrane protein OmpA-like peptidoglycan-associated protein
MKRDLAPICTFFLFAVSAVHAGGAPVDKDLQRLSADLAQLEADPTLSLFGDADRLRAHQALDALAQTGLHSRDRAQNLHIAESRVATARFAAEAELAERQLDQLDREHDKILLEASRRDAERARAEAERLRLQNTAREEEAQRAEAERQAHAQQAAGIASDESEQARALAEARAKDAALAKQEAALRSGTAPGTGAGASAASDARGPSTSLPGSAFAPGKAVLRNDAQTRTRLRALVAFVQANPGAKVRIEGHTDNRGDAQTNLSLSQQRAEVVRNALRAAGVPARRLMAVGLGGEQPVASNSTAQGRARNQRVDVIVLAGENQP